MYVSVVPLKSVKYKCLIALFDSIKETTTYDQRQMSYKIVFMATFCS